MSKNITRKAQVIIYKKTENQTHFLMLHRADKGVFWQPVTGSVEEGESYQMGAMREVEEETGIVDYIKVIKDVHNFKFESDYNGPSEERAFGMEVDVDTEPKLSHEHDSYKWCEIKEALSLLKFDSNKVALQKLFEQL